jgi:hypothetical protein
MLLPTLGGDAVGSDAATGGADGRSAITAAAPTDQPRDAHHSAWPLHSPEGCTLYSPAGRAAGLGRPRGVRNGAGTGIGHAGR